MRADFDLEQPGSAWPDRLLRLLPWLALLAALLPVVAGGFPRGHDWQYELTRIAEFRHAVADGQWPPYWAGNLYGGYGSPVFLFYAPLHAAVASLLGFLTGDPFRGAAVALFLFGAVGVLTLGTLLRAVPGLPPGAVRVGIYAYVLSPYLLGNALLRNANAEFAALSLLPLPFAGLLLVGRDWWRGIAVIALGLGLVVLAHNLTALVAMAGLLVLGALLFMPEKQWRNAAALLFGLALGLTLSSFFWLPALLLKPLVHTDDLLVGKFDFRQHFPPMAELFGYREFYAVGLIPLLLLVSAAAAFAVSRHGGPTGARPGSATSRYLAVGALAAALVCLFMQTSASLALWERLPFVAFFQFPWRFSGPLSFAVAVASALGFGEFARRASLPWRRGAEIAVFLLVLLNAAPRLAAARPLEPELRQRFAASLDAASIRRGAHRVTVLDEYLPQNADPTVWQRRPANAGPVVAIDGAARVEVKGDRGHRVELTVSADDPVRLVVGRWFFPGWRLSIDGESAAPRRHPTGAVEIAVPPGEHLVELWLEPPGGRTPALIASLLALGPVCFMAWRRNEE